MESEADAGDTRLKSGMMSIPIKAPSHASHTLLISRQPSRKVARKDLRLQWGILSCLHNPQKIFLAIKIVSWPHVRLMSTSIIPSPVERQLPPGLIFLANPISSYFNANPPYNNVILEALIFTPPPQPPRILLLQHASGGADPNAFSDYWQVPSGKPSLDDLSLLHALARVVREQTSLTISYVATMSGSEEGPGNWFSDSALWMRMLFVVEVSELAPKSRRNFEEPVALALDGESNYESSDAGAEPETLALDGESNYEPSDTSVEPESESVLAEVKIDPSKHRSHVWATEEELTEFMNSGLYPADEKTQYQIMLEAFAYYRQDLAQLKRLRQIRQNTHSGQGSGG